MRKAPPHSRLRTALTYIAAGVGALLFAELFMNLISSSTIEKSLWFTGNIHTPDDKYGFVFTPNYRGWMRHSDNVFLTPITLDEHGFRLPAGPVTATQRVVLIGGFSMTFSYGSRDGHALHDVIAGSLTEPSRVYNTAWPGFDQFRNFHIFRDKWSEKAPPDFAVILFYGETPWTFDRLPEDFNQFTKEYRGNRNMFLYFDRVAIEPPANSFELSLGKLYYRSIIVHKLATRVAKAEESIATALLDPAAQLVQKQSLDDSAAVKRTAEWTQYLQDYFGKGRVLFVFLPGADPKFNKPDYYAPLIRALPAGADYLDLQSTLRSKVAVAGYIGWDHYSEPGGVLVGNAIAAEIERVQHRNGRDLPAQIP
jgi:hypothetical protein